MKLTGQNVPGEFVARYGELLSPTDKTLTVQTRVRTRKAAKKPKPKRQRVKRTKRDIYWPVVLGLAYSFGRSDNSQDSHNWRLARLQELLAGIINLTYWQAVYPTKQAAFNDTPTYYPDPNPDPYRYRDPLNLPTIAVYHPGALVSYYDEEADEWYVPPMSFAGSTTDGRFHDDDITWHALSFKTPIEAGPLDQYPIIFCPILNVVATADRRGSRPMFSYLWKLSPSLSEPNPEAMNMPPSTNWKSGYYRYKLPITIPPYYTGNMSRHDLLVPFRDEQQYLKQWFALQLSLRPMRGHAFNNNTQVVMNATHNSRLYVPKRTIQDWRTPVFRIAGTKVRQYAPSLTTYTDWDLATCTRDPSEGLPDYTTKYSAHVGGIVVRTTFAIIGTCWKNLNRYASWANNEGVQVLGSYSDGAIYTEGPYLDSFGNPAQSIYRAPSHTSNFLMVTATPDALATILSRKFVGGFSNGMVVDDSGVAYNLHFGSITIPSFTASSCAPVFWNDKLYRQGPDGQWWIFTAPPDKGGTYHDLVSGDPWAPVAKLGNPTPKPARAWPSAIGIMMPRPFGSPSTHHLLTWEGALREFNLAGANDSDYLGTI